MEAFNVLFTYSYMENKTHHDKQNLLFYFSDARHCFVQLIVKKLVGTIG